VASSFPKRIPSVVTAGWLIENHACPPLDVAGDRNVEITSVANAETAVAGSFCFCQWTDLDQVERLAATPASVLVMGVALAPAANRCVIRVREPRRWFAEALKMLFPKAPAVVHPTAQIGVGVMLGSGPRIGAYSVIEDGARLGDDVEIGSHVVIHAGTEIGNRVIVGSHSAIGASGFGQYRDEDGSIYTFPHLGVARLGDDVEIGSSCIVVRGMLGDTEIGDGTKLGNMCSVGHNCVIGPNCWISAGVMLAGSVVVEEGAAIAGAARIKQHLRIGRGAQVGMGSVVTKDVAEGTGVFGVPAKPIPTMRNVAWPNRG
jgi:UDP-3-O-[3-hydroxymyristoyl] glucosamine N-acyltransferase